MRALRHGQILKSLEKAVHSGNITEVVPEDLEIEAHNTLWNETDPGELTLLKMLPSVAASSITHEFTKVTSYGSRRNSGFFGERSLPPETNFTAERVSVPIKLMGEIGPTFLLAALEKTQRALGTTGAPNIERVALRRNVLWKKNRNLYGSDTTKTRLGVNGLRFKGIEQLIREGTDGTDGTSPYGSHVIDMEGQPLTIETVRDKAADSMTLFGMITSLIMAPHARADFESSLDAAERLPLPISMKPYKVGQMVAGLQTQGGVVWFETDNVLSSIYYQEQYTTDLIDGAPTGVPTLAAAVVAVDAASKWDAASAGNVFYVITETVDELESLGARSPATASTYHAVAAGEDVTIAATPNNSQADSFKVYRGSDADTADTDAFFIFEVANDGVGSTDIVDRNNDRPNTTRAYGLRLISSAERAMHSGSPDAYWSAKDQSANFLRPEEDARNTVAVANLGPTMGIMALASILAEVDRPLVYSACAPEVRNPFQNFVFKNVGRVS